MWTIRWDSAKRHLRDPACIVRSGPLTFWSWHGASESLCPSAVLPVTVPKTDFTFQLEIYAPDAWMLLSPWLFCQGPEKCTRAETFRKHDCSTNWGRFSSHDTFFCACLLPRTDLIHSLYLRSCPHFGIYVHLIERQVVKRAQNIPWMLYGRAVVCCSLSKRLK